MSTLAERVETLGLSRSLIARAAGLDRNTVARVLDDLRDYRKSSRRRVEAIVSAKEEALRAQLTGRSHG